MAIEKPTIGNIRTEPYFTDRLFDRIFLIFIPQCVRPNHLTVLRFIITPLVLFLLWRGDYSWGLIFFLIAALTDALDGAMARLRQQITVWGITYDPVADKILIAGAALVLVFQKLGPGLALIIIALELISIGGGLYFKLKGKLCPATIGGKIKMILQVCAVAILLISVIFNITNFHIISYCIFVISFVFAVIGLITRGYA